MLPKAHLTSHSRMSGFRWVTIALWLSGSLRPFLYSSSVYSCYLLISSASVRSLLFLSFIMPIIARNITLIYLQFSSLFHSVVFLYFFALFIEEGILIPPCYFLKLCIQLGISSCFTLAYTSLLSLAICKQTLDQSSLPKSHPVHYNGMHQPSQVTLLGGKKPFVFPLPGVGGGVQSPSHIWLFMTSWTSMPGSSVRHCLPEFAQIHVHWVSDAV